MIHLRCSQLPRIMKCQGELQPGYIGVHVETPAASKGTAVHAELAHWLRTGEEPDEMSPTFNTFQTFRRVLTESNFALRIGRNAMMIEEALEIEHAGIRLTGHPDLFGYAPERAIDLYDWKSGWNTESDHVDQLKGYARQIFQLYEPETIRAIIVRPDCTVQQWEWTFDEISDWWADLVNKVVNWDGSFNTGEHCQYCPRLYDCPGRQQIARAASMALASGFAFDITHPEDCIRAYQLALVAGKAVEDMKDAIRDHVRHFGEISDGSHKLCLVPSNKRVIDLNTAWDPLTEHLSPAEIATACKVVLGDLETALKMKAPRGKKAEYVKEVFSQLESAGGLYVEPQTPRMVLKEVKE